jgi:hypothetical protein
MQTWALAWVQHITTKYIHQIWNKNEMIVEL